VSKKKKTKIKISFIGNNSCDVTGSMILIETEYKNILLECGMIQGFNSIVDYKENAKSFPFKPQNIDYVFLGHVHIDHIGRLPKLVRDGFNGKIITTEISAKLLKPMLIDSSNIIRKDAEYISRKRDTIFEPFYNEEDVQDTLNLTCTYDYGIIYELDENISFRFLHNSHLIGACQIELFIKTSTGHIEKILYTSDLKGLQNKNHFVEDTEFCTKANIVISECTYGAIGKNYKENRIKDLEKIKTVVNQVCFMDKGKILIPVFSLSRAQEILTNLYELFGEDKNFKTPIILDSPLIWEITKVYKDVLTGEYKELFDKVCSWENVRFIKDYNESKISMRDNSPKIVLSSSGFLHKGRSIQYLKEYISDSKNHVLFVGYSPPNSIASKIKLGQKNITIEGESYKNRCSITILNSFSSHIQRDELLNYLKNITTDKICLVHGSMDGKLEFKESLEAELLKLNKTTRVIAVNKGTAIGL
jgi:metallo-beta-lactamase family protein